MPKTKKQIIVEYCQEHGIKTAGPAEMRRIGEAIRRASGPQRISLRYIGEVLQRSGVELQYRERYLGPSISEPYASRLRGVLQFRDLASAEACLRQLNEEYQAYLNVSDHIGVSAVRSLVLKGKQRALRLAADSRVAPLKRREKQEIARWFTIWLQTPDLFFAWVELRKRSEDFQRMFDAPGE
jgi:hypothetical protein